MFPCVEQFPPDLVAEWCIVSEVVAVAAEGVDVLDVFDMFCRCELVGYDEVLVMRFSDFLAECLCFVEVLMGIPAGEPSD